MKSQTRSESGKNIAREKSKPNDEYDGDDEFGNENYVDGDVDENERALVSLRSSNEFYESLRKQLTENDKKSRKNFVTSKNTGQSVLVANTISSACLIQ